MQDFFLVTICAIFALLGHGAKTVKPLRWLIRVVIIGTLLYELQYMSAERESISAFSSMVLMVMSIATAVILFIHGRKLLSWMLTAVDGIVSLRALTGPIRHHMKVLQSVFNQVMFVPTSYPHLVGMFIYITTLGYFLQQVNPLNMEFPAMAIPLPVSISQLLSYNGIGLVMLSFCGVGIFVSRGFKEACKRLGWEKPTLVQVGIGLGLIVFSFAYDLIWALYTHGLGGQDLATKLSSYNSGTFASGADFGTSVLIALMTAICAGVGEETLTRGALQPALGIVPAAILHGVLHAQFTHAPIFIIQVALWSVVFGIARRFTNTTTTMIGHCGFNFVSTFLFAFNP